MLEQELIQKYFSRHRSACESVLVSVGDDAAVVAPPKDSKLVVTTDTLNVGKHFLSDCKAEFVGHKSLAVNLSDIAAMGAKPLWATLNLSLPAVDHAWLEGFSDGLYALANQYNLKIIGGDLVSGPLSITVQIIGYVDINQPLLRSGCQLDDLIYVSGYLGDAAMGLQLQNDKSIQVSKNNLDYFLTRLHTPKPRLDISEKIVGFSTSAIDTSDGFLIDLQRILTMSDKAAIINLDAIPISIAMQAHISNIEEIKRLLCSGEDYELIFTIKPDDKFKLEEILTTNNMPITEVGKIVKGSGISLLNNGLETELPNELGFDHFS